MKPAWPDISEYAWLTSDAGTVWLARAAEELRASDVVATAARLRRDLSARQTHLALEQVALRERARRKFRLADAMFFTAVALEQATDETIARYKARRFPADGLAVDVCCGIGGDAIGLALTCRQARGIDRNPVHALLAEANVRCYLSDEGLARDRFVVDAVDAAAMDMRCDAWHADPDRRAAGRRTTSVDAHDPPAEILEQWLRQTESAAIKLAPAARLPEMWRTSAECEWISRHGECKQLLAWFGSLARRPGMRVATVIDSDRRAHSFCGRPGAQPPRSERIARYLYEPDAAVLAAGLQGALAEELGLAAIGPGIAYLTGDERIVDPAANGFEVLDVLPLQIKRLKAYCRQHRIGQAEVKKRGVACEPEALQRQLRGDGDETAVVLATRFGGKSVAVIARRI